MPTDALDDMWRAYEAFEFGGPNRTLAKRLVDEHRPIYQLVRRPADAIPSQFAYDTICVRTSHISS